MNEPTAQPPRPVISTTTVFQIRINIDVIAKLVAEPLITMQPNPDVQIQIGLDDDVRKLIESALKPPQAPGG